MRQNVLISQKELHGKIDHFLNNFVAITQKESQKSGPDSGHTFFGIPFGKLLKSRIFWPKIWCGEGGGQTPSRRVGQFM